MKIRFTKMEGTGNDFVFIEDATASFELTAKQVAFLCDRHFGIGADGIILVRPPRVSEADACMYYINADGSLAEMCGNGVRAFAKYVVDHGICRLREGNTLVVDTLGGLKPVTCTLDADGTVTDVCVDMGAPIIEPEAIPVTFIAGNMNEPLIDQHVSLPFGDFTITTVSMGNPHCVIFGDDPSTAEVETIGPQMETSALFPNKTNVEFAHVEGNRIKVRTWERGVGETYACGTGACATAVAAALTGRSGREVTVELLGGELHVEWAPNDHVFMTGPAKEVFIGEITL